MNNIHVTVVRTLQELVTYRDTWRAIHDSSTTTPFQSFEWNLAWWQHLGASKKDRELSVIFVSEDNSPIGVGPFYIERTGFAGLGILRKVVFVGRGDSDYLDIMSLPGKEGLVVEAIVSFWDNHPRKPQLIYLQDIGEFSRHRALLLEKARLNGIPAESIINERCPRLRLSHTWDETKALFGKQLRSQLPRKEKTLRRDHQVAYEAHDDAGQAQPAMSSFIEMHQQRWNRDGLPGVFAQDRARAFHIQVAEEFLLRGWLWIRFLVVDGERIASLYGFSHEKVFYYYLNGIRDLPPEMMRLSPGLLLHEQCIRECILRGHEIYDFMRGTERYKYEFGSEDVPNWTLTLFLSRSRLTQLRLQVSLLHEALLKRRAYESAVWRLYKRGHPFLPTAMVVFLVRRTAAVASDAFYKLRSPSTPTAFARESSAKKLHERPTPNGAASAASSPVKSTQPGEIRPLSDGDIPGVADLFWKIFRRQKGSSPASLRKYFEDLYLNNPWRSNLYPSYVHVTRGGRVSGFVGSIPRPMTFRDQSIMTVVAGNHMMDPELHDPFAAPLLLRKLLSGPQELTFSDSANESSRRMWESLGARTSHIYSLRWLRLLRPFCYGTFLMERRKELRIPSMAMRPFTMVLDHLIGSPIANKGLRERLEGLADGDFSVESALKIFPSLSRTKELRPLYDREGLQWLLQMAEEKQQYGPFFKYAVTERSVLIGWYMFYGKPGRVAEVLQIVSMPNEFEKVFSHLCVQAYRRGCVALMGSVFPDHMLPLSNNGAFFLIRNTSMIAHSRSVQLGNAILRGDAFLTRLDAEWWTRLQGDRFY